MALSRRTVVLHSVATAVAQNITPWRLDPLHNEAIFLVLTVVGRTRHVGSRVCRT